HWRSVCSSCEGCTALRQSSRLFQRIVPIRRCSRCTCRPASTDSIPYRAAPLMDLANSQQQEGGIRLAKIDIQAAVQLVFVESEPQASEVVPRIRSVPVAADADVTAVIAQRRPDLLLVDAAVFAAAG